MRLTPLDIRKQEFARRVRGVDPEEVDAFLQTVSVQWDELLADQRLLEAKVREMETKLQHYVHVEEALQEALRTARESARQTLDTAKQQAEGLLRAARQQADEIRRAAEQESVGLRREFAEARARRDEIVARLRAFLSSEMELLRRFEGDQTAQPSTSYFNAVAGDAMLSGVAPAVEASHLPVPASGDAGSGAFAQPPVPESAARPAERDETRLGGGWVVKPVMGSASRPSETEDDARQAAVSPAATEEDLERIRQILEDLE